MHRSAQVLREIGFPHSLQPERDVDVHLGLVVIVLEQVIVDEHLLLLLLLHHLRILIHLYNLYM
jgi:hypothetical protein